MAVSIFRMKDTTKKTFKSIFTRSSSWPKDTKILEFSHIAIRKAEIHEEGMSRSRYGTNNSCGLRAHCDSQALLLPTTAAASGRFNC